MELKEAWAACEQKYLECFCRRTKDGFFTKYTDPAVPDWEYANCVCLRKSVSPLLLRRTLDEKVAAAKAAGAPHFCLTLAKDPASMADALPAGGTVFQESAYAFTKGRDAAQNWAYSGEIEIRQMTAENASDMHLVDQEAIDADTSSDYIRRRTLNRIEVFLKSPAMHNHLAYLDGKPVGKCCLFQSGTAARLENLRTIPAARHRRAASTLLRTLALQAYDAGCETLFLSADENDTPKEMYKAMGFEKISDSWMVTWYFDD